MPMNICGKKLNLLHGLQMRSWFDLAGGAAFAAILALIMTDYAAGDPRRWFALALVLLYAVLHVLNFSPGPGSWREQARMALLTAIPVTLAMLDAQGLAVVLLFFLLSARAMSVLPLGWAYIWIGGFGLITLGIHIYWSGPTLAAVLSALGTFAGYAFFGATVASQHEAEQARAESQRLLNELQQAHRQLRAYAERVEELAVSEERNRLAREVHDSLGHRLTVAAVQLEGAQRLMRREPEKAEQIVGTVRAQVLDGLDELRRTVATLRAPLEAELPLPQALAHLADQFGAATNIPVFVTLPDAPLELPSEHRHALYRAAQEALTNIQRHAHAEHAWLRLECSDECVTLSITDDGVGLSRTSGADANMDKFAGGFGLRSLRERAVQLGGQCHIQSNAGGGVHIEFVLPVESSDDTAGSANYQASIANGQWSTASSHTSVHSLQSPVSNSQSHD